MALPVPMTIRTGMPGQGRRHGIAGIQTPGPDPLPSPATPTPAHEAQLQEVVPEVGVEDPDDEQVEVEGLQDHPGEDAEQEVVEDGPPDRAGRGGPLWAMPHIDKEG